MKFLSEMSNEAHAFSPDVAAKVGVKSALIMGHLVFLHKYLLGNKDAWDGSRYWIKKTATAFTATYPYFTPREIRGALDALEKEGFIMSQTGISDKKFDRTRGYSIQEDGFDLMQIKPEHRQVFRPFYKKENGNNKKVNDILQNRNLNTRNSYSSYYEKEKEGGLSPAEFEAFLKETVDALKAENEALKAKIESAEKASASRRANTPELGDHFSRFDQPAAMPQLWERWCQYKADYGHKYKSADSVITGIKKLHHLSGGKFAVAFDVIENSIGNGWQGLFEIKKQQQSTYTQQPAPITPKRKRPVYDASGQIA